MKKINSALIATAFAFAGLTLNSCHSPVNQPTPAANGTLEFHIHTNVGANEVEGLNEVYQLVDGRKISVSKAQLYISGIQLVKADGTFYDVEGEIVLAQQGIEEYTVGSVPAGNYKGVRFNVGLSATQNAKTPTSADTALNNSEMWFGSAAQPEGFVFINFQGKIDTTTAANGTEAQMQPFVYKVGTNANLKSVIMPEKNFAVNPEQTGFVHLTADFAKLLNGLELNKAENITLNTVAENGEWLGTTLSGNVGTIFSYEE